MTFTNMGVRSLKNCKHKRTDLKAFEISYGKKKQNLSARVMRKTYEMVLYYFFMKPKQ